MSDQESKRKMKSILNIWLNFYIFGSITSKLIFDAIQELMESFSEGEIEILIYLLHNIGLQLRADDPK
jgi:hypothetical protein